MHPRHGILLEQALYFLSPGRHDLVLREAHDTW